MADTKSGRDKQARDQERRRAERDITEARERGDEPEPSPEPPAECHRRGCSEPVAFTVTERYQEETGAGAVEATAFLCVDHAAGEFPTNLDGAYDGYEFRIVPVNAEGDD
jgi:hypothetical protein